MIILHKILASVLLAVSLLSLKLACFDEAGSHVREAFVTRR